jgi:carboxypeptidase family protein
MRIASREMSGNRPLKLDLLLTTAFCVLFTLAMASVPACAQENPTGNINGKVTSANGAPIEGARVTITNQSTGQTVAVRTDAAGTFAAVSLPPTDYSFHVDAKDFISTSQVANVEAEKTTSIDFVMDPEPVTGVLPADNVRGLPINDRNFLSPASLEPGVQFQDGGTIDPTKTGFPTLSFGSEFGRAETIQIDSVDTTDETVGTTTQSIPFSAVQAFRMGGLLAPISDQIASGGANNIVTRAGTNSLHGELFGNYGDGNVLAASLPGGNSHDWGRQRFGGDIGDALIADKLFVFVSAERNRQDVLNPVLLGGPFAPFPSSLTRLREPFREVDADGRIDYVLSPATRAFYRFSYDNNRDQQPFEQGPSLQPFLTRTNTPAHVVGVDFGSGSYTHSVRFEYLRFKNAINDASTAVTGFANPVPDVTVDIGGGSQKSCTPGAFFCSGPSSLAPQQTFQSDRQFRYDGTHVRGDHLLHFGVSYNRILAGIFSPFYSLAPTLADQGGAPLAGNPVLGISGSAIDPLSYPVEWAFLGNGQGFASERSQFGLPGGGQQDNRLFAYAGDTWKIWPNLTVNYGVSWVRDDGKSDSDLGAIPQLNAWGPGLGKPVRQPNYNFGPQLGVAWDPHNSGRTTIRAGIGLYYDNAIFNNILFDRPLRLAQGSFFATPAACVGGAPGNIQWPSNPGAVGTPVAGGSGIVNANGTVSPTWCGGAIGLAAPQAVTLQQAYQAATLAAAGGANPSFVGNPGAFAGPYENGLSALAPNYQTPRSVQMDIGLQHELKPGLIFNFDYVRDVTTRTLLGIDVNEGGAAATFNQTNAVSDRDAAQTANGCPTGFGQVSCMVAKLGPSGALAAYGAAGIGGPAQVTGGAACPFCAFPGLQPSLGVNVMNYPVGRSVYSGLNVGLKQVVRNFSVRGFQRATFELSYSHSRFVGQAGDPDFANQATDYGNPDGFTGPNALDRKHQVSFGALFDLQKSFQLSFVGHFDSPLPVTLTFPQTSGGAEILVTDVTGDGTTGDIIPGSNVGSYMRSIKPRNFAKFIQNYNNTIAGSANPATPAGNMLVNGGIFTLQELEQIGGVQQPLAAAVNDVAGLGWLKTFDLKLGWEHTYRDRITFQPSISLFNVFNFANFDLPGNTQNGVLSFGQGSLSPFATVFQPENTVGGNSPNPLLNFGRSNRASLGSGLNAQGAPRAVEWGLKISF